MEASGLAFVDKCRQERAPGAFISQSEREFRSLAAPRPGFRASGLETLAMRPQSRSFGAARACAGRGKFEGRRLEPASAQSAY